MQKAGGLAQCHTIGAQIPTRQSPLLSVLKRTTSPELRSLFKGITHSLQGNVCPKTMASLAVYHSWTTQFVEENDPGSQEAEGEELGFKAGVRRLSPSCCLYVCDLKVCITSIIKKINLKKNTSMCLQYAFLYRINKHFMQTFWLKLIRKLPKLSMSLSSRAQRITPKWAQTPCTFRKWVTGLMFLSDSWGNLNRKHSLVNSRLFCVASLPEASSLTQVVTRSSATKTFA